MGFTSADDINILQKADIEKVGASFGDDIYILGNNSTSEGQKIQILDGDGNNTLRLFNGVTIKSSQVTNDAVELTLNNDSVVTVFNAYNFTFDVGNDAIDETPGTSVQDFETFAKETLGVTVPAEGAAPVQGGEVTIGGEDDPTIDIDNTLTLTELPTQTETTLTWNGVDVDEAIAFLQTITGLDLEDLGIDITEGDVTINVTNSGDEAYIDFWMGEDLFQYTVDTPAALYAEIMYGLQTDTTTTQEAIVLTPTENNGGTFESGFTTDDNDLIIAGRTELLHGAYIDGGEGYNIIEVDMKGFFAQPYQLLNIQEVRIQNLENYYNVDQTILDGVSTNFPVPEDQYLQGDDSVLDLSRASDLEVITITESGATGGLTVLGIKNAATASLSGDFQQDVDLYYNTVTQDYLDIKLYNVTFDADFTIAHNVGTLNVYSGGNTNVLDGNVDFGDYFQELYVTGSGQLVIEEDLEFAFGEAFIDASENTGGLRVSVSSLDDAPLEVVEVMGSKGRDVITLDNVADGALLTIDTNSGRDTLVIEQGLSAGAGSVITGDNLTVQVDANADLTLADVSGVDNFTISDGVELLLTLAQVDEVGIENFSADHDTISVLTIELTEDAILSEIIDLTALDSDIRLAFEVQSNVTLTMTAEELHTYLTEDAVTGDGDVVITEAGLEFDIDDRAINTANADVNGAILGDGFGTIEANSVDGEIHVERSQDGYERPLPDDDTDTLIIDTTGDAAVEIDGLDAPQVETLIIKGDQDAVFTDTVELAEDFTIDFSELTGNLTGLTVEDFNTVKKVIGNGADDVRIDVMLSGNVEEEDPAEGLHSSGVAQYVVVDINDTANDDGDNDATTVSFHLCDNTQDLEVIGLQGNAGSTLTFTNVPWGAVNPTILLEGDGKGDWTELDKADGNPDESNVGTVVAEFFFDGAPAEVLITNQKVAPGITSTGGERPIVVDGIVLDNATSLDITVEDGNAVISDITDGGSGDGLKDITMTSANDVTLHLDNDESAVLDSIDAYGVAGDAVLVIDANQIVDLSGTALTDIDAIQLEDSADLTLSIEQITDMGIDVLSHADFDDDGDEATLNIAGLDEDAFSMPEDSAEGIELGTVTIADEDSVVLHADTDLTGATAVIVPAGTIVTMTAAQFMQFGTYDADNDLIAAPVVTGGGTINITGLTQELVNEGFTLENVTALEGEITLTEDVALDNDTDLGDASIELATGQTINFATVEQASAREVTVADGATDTTVEFAFTNSADGDPETGFDFNDNGVIGNGDLVEDNNVTEETAVDTSNYSNELETLKVRSSLLADENVEQVLAGLASEITVDIFTPIDDTIVNGTNRVVVAEANTIVEGSLEFDDLQGNVRVETLDLTLQGGVQIAADDDDSGYAIDVAEATAGIAGFQKLTIGSDGETPNVLGDEDNMDGDIKATGNDLLDVEINASQDLIINGDIIFTKAGDAVDDAAATLTLNGAADITIAALDVSDTDVDTLNIANNATGTVTILGLSPALTMRAGADDETGEAQTSKLVISGTGDELNFGTADDPTTEEVDESNSGVNVSGLTDIDASAFEGDLDLGIITGRLDDDEALTITGSQGITTLTIGAANDNNSEDLIAERMFIMANTADVTIDLSASAAGSSVTLSGAAVLPDMTGEDADEAGSLTIKAETLVIEGNVDLSELMDADGTSKLDLTGVSVIELAEGASLKMDDEQWDDLTADQQEDIEGAGQTLVVDQDFINENGADLTELRGITTIQIDEDVNAALTMTDDQAAMAITGEFDNEGVFTAGTWDDDEDADTDDIAVEAGNFINLDTATVQVNIDTDADLTGFIAVDAFDLDMAEDTYALLTLMDTQVAALAAGDNDLTAHSAAYTDDWENASDLDQLATGSVVKIEVQTGENSVTDEPVLELLDAKITIDRTTDDDGVEIVDVTGNAAALAAADAAFDAFLNSAATVEWTAVGSDASAAVTLDATDALDTFTYTETPESVVITNFSTGADGDGLDVSAVLGEDAGTEVITLGGTPDADFTDGDESDVNLGGTDNIAQIITANGAITAADVVLASDLADDGTDQIGIADGGQAVIAVANANGSSFNLYSVYDDDEANGVFDAGVDLIGTIFSGDVIEFAPVAIDDGSVADPFFEVDLGESDSWVTSADDLLLNDYDVDTDHDDLTITSVTPLNPNVSDVDLSADGSTITFTVTDGTYEGPVRFRYTVSDGTPDTADADANVFGTVTAPAEPPTYALEADANDVNEGDTATFSLETTNLEAGDEVAYTISGSDGFGVDDIAADALAGTVEVDADGNATIEVVLLADETTEDEETLTVTIDEDPTATADVAVNDTSTDVLAVDVDFTTNEYDALDVAEDITVDLNNWTSNFKINDFNAAEDELIIDSDGQYTSAAEFIDANIAGEDGTWAWEDGNVHLFDPNFMEIALVGITGTAGDESITDAETAGWLTFV